MALLCVQFQIVLSLNVSHRMDFHLIVNISGTGLLLHFLHWELIVDTLLIDTTS